MKIVLVPDDEPLWGRVRAYLVGINADVSTVHDPARLRRGSGADALDLVVAGPGPAADPAVRALRVPVIVVAASGAAGPRAPAGAVRLQWPFTKSALLEATATLLKIEPRKRFHTLIRVGLAGERPATIAESNDFSSAGMSFTSAGYFVEGSRIAISLSLPQADTSLLLHGTVVRTFREGPARPNFHGVSLADPGDGTRELLRRFVRS